MAIGDWLNQTCTVETFHSVNAYGDMSYNSSATVACRISYKHRRVVNAAGEEVTSTAKVTAETAYTVRDRFTVDGNIRVPISVGHVYDGAGTYHHTAVYL